MKRAKVLALATIPMALAIGFSGSAAAAQQPAAKPAAQPAAKPAAQPAAKPAAVTPASSTVINRDDVPNATKPMAQGSVVSTLTFGDPVDIPPGGWAGTTVQCPAGSAPLGGGGATSAFNIFLTDSRNDGNNGWFVGGRNTGDNTESLAAYVTCTAP